MDSRADKSSGVPMSGSAVTTASPANDIATVIAVGVLAATVAVLSHETLGHGAGCLSIGGHVTLLTSTLFRCSRYAPIADAGGPLGNLVAGCVAIALLRLTTPSSTGRLFLVLVSALNLFWFSAQIGFESATATPDDWNWLLQMRPALCRPVGVAIGIVGYLLVRRWITAINRGPGGPEANAVLLAYAAAATAAFIAGLMWRPEPLRGALQGFLTLGLAPLGLLKIAGATRAAAAGSRAAVPRSWPWLAVCIVLFGLFLFIQARGVGGRAGLPVSTFP